MNNIPLIKWLIQEGFRDKVIQIITRSNQSYISKIRNKKLQQTIKAAKVMSTEEEKRYGYVKTILSLRELYGSVNERQDLLYIHLLKFFLVDKEDVYNLYFHWSKMKFSRYWAKKNVNLLKFNSELIEIPYTDYLDLIIDFYEDWDE